MPFKSCEITAPVPWFLAKIVVNVLFITNTHQIILQGASNGITFKELANGAK